MLAGAPGVQREGGPGDVGSFKDRALRKPGASGLCLGNARWTVPGGTPSEEGLGRPRLGRPPSLEGPALFQGDEKTS